MQRLPTARGISATLPQPGPVAEVHGHVALVPMVRVGGYVSEDLSRVAGRPARQFTDLGLRVKVTPALLPAPWRVWAFTGLGYARAVQPSYAVDATATVTLPRVPGAAGGVLDLPVGIGVGFRPRAPWVVTVELAGRVGLAFTGAMYDRKECGCATSYAGRDSFALELTVGVSLEQ